MTDDTPYKVEPAGGSCQACGHGERWDVIAPDDTAESTQFDEEEDAEAYARALNRAYHHGRAHGDQRRDGVNLEHARAIVDAVLADLSGRRGFRHLLEEIRLESSEFYAEMLGELYGVAYRVLAAGPKGGA